MVLLIRWCVFSVRHVVPENGICSRVLATSWSYGGHRLSLVQACHLACALEGSIWLNGK